MAIKKPTPTPAPSPKPSGGGGNKGGSSGGGSHYSPPPPPPPPPPKKENAAFVKGTPDNLKPVIQQAAQKTGISTAIISSQLQHESNFDTKARGSNTDKSGKLTSTDRGIAQINNVWHPEITDQQADDPQFAVNWLANQLKEKVSRLGSVSAALSEYNSGSPTAAVDTYAKPILQNANDAGTDNSSDIQTSVGKVLYDKLMAGSTLSKDDFSKAMDYEKSNFQQFMESSKPVPTDPKNDALLSQIDKIAQSKAAPQGSQQAQTGGVIASTQGTSNVPAPIAQAISATKGQGGDRMTQAQNISKTLAAQGYNYTPQYIWDFLGGTGSTDNPEQKLQKQQQGQQDQSSPYLSAANTGGRIPTPQAHLHAMAIPLLKNNQPGV